MSEPIAPVDQEVLDFLRRIATGYITDALERLKLNGCVMGIHPLEGCEERKVVGPAVTMRFLPNRVAGIAKPRIKLYDVVEASPAGSVVVLEGHGVADMCFMGGNQAKAARTAGMAGVVVDGGVRDAADIRKLGLPVFCTAAAVRRGATLYDLADYNVPIAVGGVQVRPGDLVVGDEDGVVVIPRESLSEVLGHVRAVAAAEEELDRAIVAGAPAEEIRALLAKKRAQK